MLLKALQDAKYVRDPEGAVIQWKKNLRSEVACDVIDQVFQPMVLVGVARQWVPGPVVDRVQVLP